VSVDSALAANCIRPMRALGDGECVKTLHNKTTNTPTNDQHLNRPREKRTWQRR